MKVIYSEDAFQGASSVVALGMFDGVHVGHQRLIRTAVRLARELNAEAVVCTFDRHPLSVLCPERAPQALLTPEENLEKFEALGADVALMRAFTREFAALEPETYLRMLCEKLRARAIVAGENYTFGRKGLGDAKMIRELADTLSYRAVIVEPVADAQGMISSTRIRELMKNGEYDRADALLRLHDPSVC